MSARDALRDATRADHERVDAAFSRFDVTQPDGYRAFLTAQAAALLPAEAAIDAAGGAALAPDWPDRRRGPQLIADLAALGAEPAAGLAAPVLADAAQALGALYVLEGSRMGAGLLRRGLAPDMPHAFLGARAAPGAWRRLMALLDAQLNSPSRVDAAIGAARDMFMAFETAARSTAGVRAK